MEHIRRIQEFEHIKILADERRLAILRLLMLNAATLTQLGERLGEHPARVRHHLKLLETAGLVELVETRVVKGFVEKYYRAAARAFVLHELVLPSGLGGELVVVMGSHDLALEALVLQISEIKALPIEYLSLPVGSLEGLIALRQGLAQIAGCHLLDPESGEYNLPYVKRIFPDRAVTLITLADRQQGLIVARGNPNNVRSLADLEREDITMVNRSKGSGTRLWLDQELERSSLSPENMNGYASEVRTHTAVAETVRSGTADAGLGLHAAAQGAGLGFVPLYKERFDLVMDQEVYKSQLLRPIIDDLQSDRFEDAVNALAGYDATHTGEITTV